MPGTDLLVLGAGAAGLMAALTASARGLAVTVADGGPVAGRKVRVAGGGKGNFTNRHMSPEHFHGADPAFVRPALRAFPADAMLRLLDTFGVPWEEREYGQIFGTVPAVRVVEALTERCRAQGVRFLFRATPAEAEQRPSGEFAVRLTTPDGHETFMARRLLLALGSPAWPQCGATDAGLRLTKAFGHGSTPFRPALTPLVMEPRWLLEGLQGISADVRLCTGGLEFRQPLLVTHRGLSGPAVLQASAHWRQGQPLTVDFLPNQPLKALMHAPENGALPPATLLRRHLPQRLADCLLTEALQRLKNRNLPCPDPSRGVAQWGRAQREVLTETVHALSLFPLRSEGMKQAEAALGGVLTQDFNPRTMESRRVPGLFAAGELMDITGDLGGYNLHWAFAGGLLAGTACSRKG